MCTCVCAYAHNTGKKGEKKETHANLFHVQKALREKTQRQ